MPRITTKLGLAIAAVVWVVFTCGAISQGDCLRSDTCDFGDLMLAALVGVGMVVPAFFLGAIVSAMQPVGRNSP